ncbi:DUF3347 domain-containing protein [Mucilaginibacter sabulilitoris]|uniref:DUF3347 domain-containing protein n=1 Tax=Mucilaginibacter sabulilitoris TaxID=1173583 RepID=A0ABZ0TPE4_9SPHI|nr:DUF3347 domain-containing protein [Mucilaginibacter sabulilitoris]WPU95021.1 DUF3347 domain-containing protein [Mucilaginibacter sabulilitoris]
MKTLKTFIILITVFISYSNAKAQDNPAGVAVNNVLTAYLDVKNALTADDKAAAKTKAADLLTAITAVPMNKLTPEQHKLWMTYFEKLRFDSKHISESDAIDHQREHFTSLSKNLYEVTKGLKLNTATVYEQYCPMKKATWLSETSAVKNPYYGKQMLTCGKTTETLTPAVK